MKLKDGFILREVNGQTVVIPSGDELDLNVMITLNETGKLLWERLEQGAEEAELTAALLAEYYVDKETAREHVRAFVQKLQDNDFLE